jgi:hypothetical protein
MSRTRQDSRQGTAIEVTKRADGTFDLFLNHELDHERIDGDWLVDVLCARFGYCADECDAILFELHQNGKAERRFLKFKLRCYQAGTLH